LSTLAIATAKEVFDLLGDDLRAIEREFGRDAVSSVAAITEITGYLREGGGKRIRPLLLLLAAKSQGLPVTAWCGWVRLSRWCIRLRWSMTTSSMRRIHGAGGLPPTTTWGNAKCVLAGDWLYMQAFRVSLEERNFRVLDLLIGLTQQMVEGELLQMEKLAAPLPSRNITSLSIANGLPVRSLHAAGIGAG